MTKVVEASWHRLAVAEDGKAWAVIEEELRNQRGEVGEYEDWLEKVAATHPNAARRLAARAALDTLI